jgi:hypothetical protein
MNQKQDYMDRAEKNQLIAREIPHKRPWFTRSFVAMVGGGFLAVGLVWTFIIMYVFFMYLIKSDSADSDIWARVGDSWVHLVRIEDQKLDVWSKLGEATSGSLALAALGAIILSFRYVILELEAQQEIERRRFQPVVTCSAYLDYHVEGTESKEKVKIAKASLKLKIQNIGDSPATFGQVEIKRCDLNLRGNVSKLFDCYIKGKLRRFDKILHNNSEEYFDQYTDIVIAETFPEAVEELIYGILCSESHDSVSCLELEVIISHKNIMGIEYRRQGTFVWSQELRNLDKSELHQLEYLNKFFTVRHQVNTKTNRDQNNNTVTIGHFIRYNMPLQAAVIGPDVKRKARTSL